MEIVGVDACTRRIAIMKERLPFCKEFIIRFIEDRVVADCVV